MAEAVWAGPRPDTVPRRNCIRFPSPIPSALESANLDLRESQAYVPPNPRKHGSFRSPS